MKKEITANGSTAVITTDMPMEQTIVIEPEPLDSISFAGIEVQTGNLWAGLFVVMILAVLARYFFSKK
tara:strand:- start:340 stop:543 length:204 start_codon:yes stop_codon:yes gene_type:complete